MARRELRDDEVIRVGDLFDIDMGLGAHSYANPSSAIGMTVGARRTEICAGDDFRVFRDEPDEPAPKKGDPVAWAPPTREELENARRELSKPTPTVPPYSTLAPLVYPVADPTMDERVHLFADRRFRKEHGRPMTRLERVKAGLELDPYLEGRTRWKANSGRAEPYVISGTGPAETRSALGRVKDLSRPPLTILGPDGSGDDIAADADSPYWKTKR